MSYQNQLRQEGEIDVMALILLIWKGKWIVIACTLFFSFWAVFYALNTQQWWSSQAKVTVPQLQDFSEYALQVKKLQPVFDLEQEDGSVLVSKKLDPFIKKDTLFSSFITEFNANRNKRIFLDNSVLFQSILLEVGEDNLDAYYNAWFGKIYANQSNIKRDDIFDIKVQAMTKSDSYQMLNNYIEYVSNIVRINHLRNLQITIENKYNELLQKKSALILLAKRRLNVEIQRTEYALQVAIEANLERPIQNLSGNEIFPVSLGSTAIEAKIKALKSIDNLHLFEPRLQQLESKLALIKNTQINNDIMFESFRYLEQPQPPLNRDKPKRALIAVLGALLGGMLGLVIVLLRFAFRKEDNIK